MRFALLLAPLLLCACAAEPAPKPAPRPRHVAVDRGVLRAFRAYVYAGYGLVLARERPEQADTATLKERQALAREELRTALVDAGADPATLGDDAAKLVATVGEGIARGGRYALLARVDGAHTDSVRVVRLRERDLQREVRLFDETFRYRVTSFDETLVADYDAWRAEQLGQPAAREVAVYREDGRIQLDLGAAREVGAKLFLPRVEALAQAAAAADEEAFVRRADRLAQLLGLAKAVLRWRSLEALWSRIRSRPPEEQLQRFVEDYVERAELRAAAELHALSHLRGAPPPGQELPPLDDAARQRLFELGSLSAAIHGEPLGQVADLLGLAVLSLDGPRHEAHFRAARQLVLDLVARLRQGPPSDQADARALAKLARASAEEARALARELHAARAR
ncbi:MAG: hypothetical protein AB7N76_20955 [Planctomycetota bacterium]